MRLKPLVVSVALALAATLAVGPIGLSANAAPTLPHASVRQVVPNWVTNATVYEVNIRQFSPAGNFAGVTAALPRIKALGTDVIWLMPIYPVGKLNAKGTLGSPYAVANYKAVNPDYGTDADFKTLVDTAHSLGLKVVLDWVPNHTAWDNPWVTQHPDWYTHDASGNIISPAGTDWTDVADLNYNNPDLRAAMTDALKYWVTKFDIDGYRCDYAGGVPTDFWDSATAAVDQVKQLWWLAEDQSDWDLLSQSFSSNYNWELLGALNKVGGRDDILFAMADSTGNYPSNTFPLNFITNHDENSWNGTEFQRMGKAVPESAAITFITPGIPLIYDGQEIGLNHQLAFFEKDPIDWGADPASSTWTAFYSKLINLRKNNSALYSGTAGGPLGYITTGNDNVLSVSRVKGTNRVVLLANLSAKATKVKVPVDKSIAGKYVDYNTGKSVTLTKGKSSTLTIPGWGFVIYSTVAAN
ncbi:MAG: hypothetical protein RJA35_44 [Actinomycetota bacterium]|jgi:glycosidase